jgi:glycosyltransferase involved in cell wall biosynthesis
VKPRLLVVSPVHPPDDPRIRHKLIKTLDEEWDVTYGGRDPGPIDQTGVEWIELRGCRAMRDVRATRLLLAGNYEVASVHDPELLPGALLAGLFGRRVVFDVHENVPGQLATKDWLPRGIRRPLAWLMGRLLRIAERRMEMTLAEEGYRELFAQDHPVFPNYLKGDPPVPRDPDPAVGAVYLGDVTEARGLMPAVEAVATAGVATMTLMGRCRPEFQQRLLETASRHGLQLRFRGFVDLSEALAVAAAGQLGLSPLLDTPNYRASLPTKVLEYLAVGIPTIASDLPGTRSVVGERAGVVLAPPGDVAAWREAIRRVLGDPNMRTAAADGAVDVRREFVWPTADVRDYYRGLLEEAAG